MSQRIGVGVYMRHVPPDGTGEIEINNDTPRHSLCLEGCWGVEELELWDMSEREKKGRNVY